MKLKNFLNESDVERKDYNVRLSITPISGISFDIQMPRNIRLPDTLHERLWDSPLRENKVEFKKLLDFLSKLYKSEDERLTKELTEIVDVTMTLIRAKLQESVFKMEKEFEKKVKQ